MLNVTVFAVGRLKEPYFAAACEEYQKRLSSFCRLTVTEIEESRLPQNPSASDIEKCIAAEGRNILAKLPKRAFVIPLCIEGETLTSPQLAQTFGKISAKTAQVAFVIGGSHGLSDEVKQTAGFRLSMSGMTFPHQLARVMLLEQIYRAFSILSNLKYHK